MKPQNDQSERQHANEERNRFLRQSLPGDKLELGCSDGRSRTVTIENRMEIRNGTVIFVAKGYGTRYELVALPDDNYRTPPELDWPSGHVFVRSADLVEESEQIWSDTTAEDLGIQK